MQLNQEFCSLLKGKEKLKHSRLADDPDKKTLLLNMVCNEQATTQSANCWPVLWITQTVGVQES